MDNPTPRLHPLIMIAAIAVTLFSLAGIGVITGDEDIERLTSHRSGKKRSGVGGVESLDHFRAGGDCFR